MTDQFSAGKQNQNTDNKIMNKQIAIIDVARLCHETNRVYCQIIGDLSQLPWGEAPEWQRSSAIKGVEFHLANPLASASASHESWLEVKRAEGWKYGPVKNAETKEHPCFVPFAALPVEQQAKDMLFKHIVDSLRHIVNAYPGCVVETKAPEAPTLPRFQSHKIVEAAKIAEIICLPAGGCFLVPDFAPDNRITVSDAYMEKHKPVVGGYYVKYADGYESFSPAAAFESGYTPVN